MSNKNELNLRFKIMKKERFLPAVHDCKHRENRYCRKTNKIVALDMRDPDNIKCWDRYGCDYYETKQ